MGQLISQKISPDGYVICCSDTVTGSAQSVRPEHWWYGYWVVYQNGRAIAVVPRDRITMAYVAEYYLLNNIGKL